MTSLFFLFLLFATTYPKLSRWDGLKVYDFNTPAPVPVGNQILWDDSTAILWDDSTAILWDS